MVQFHLTHNQHTAAGLCSPAGIILSFATTQAAWRFLNNFQATPFKLFTPLGNNVSMRHSNSSIQKLVLCYSSPIGVKMMTNTHR
jgi:hypothetical protein